MAAKRFSGSLHYLVPAIVLVGLLTLFIPVSVTKAESAVTFPDSNLEAAIREAIGKPSGDIYESDLVRLTSLYAYERGITDLTGLGYCTSLNVLYLGHNQITDVTSLAGLANLTVLQLSANQIGDVSPLADLTSLTVLYVGINQVSDVSPLASVTNLTVLYLTSNQISDVSPLAGLTNLTALHLGYNQISDVSPLAGLSNLTVLHLRFNQTSDISPLAGLTNLTELRLDNNEISDISPLAGLTSLAYLDLDNNQTSDVEALVDNSGMASGDHVYLRGNPLNSASVDTYIPTLEGRGVTVYCCDASTNQPPDQPGNLSPTDAASDVSLTPTLQSSIFADPDDADTHAASQWQITTISDNYTVAVFDSSTDSTHLISITVPALTSSTTYYWHVRHQDNHGVWSLWSTETSFATVDAPPDQAPSQPSNVLPASGASSITLTPTLQSSTFSDSDTGDIHAASQWQVRTSSGNYSSPVFDSDTDTTYLTRIVTSALSYSTTYYWRVRHQDNHGIWSDWSAETSFTATAFTDTTSPTTPAVTDDGTTTASASQLHATWISSDPESGIVDYRYAIGTTPGGTDVVAWISVGIDTEATKTGLSLAMGMTYYFSVKAKNAQDLWSVVGVSDGIQVIETATPPMATTNGPSGVTTNSARLSGNLASPGTATSVNVSFEYRAGTGSYTQTTESQTMTGSGIFYLDLGGLIPGTTYYYRAKAVGDGTAYGTEKTFTALAAPAVATSDATNVRTTSARLNANLASLGTKSSVTVSFLWKVSGGTYAETIGQAKTAPGTVSADLSSLAPGTTYYYEVKVVGDGDLVYGAEKSFATASLPDTTAPMISSCNSSGITTSSATITWTTNEPATSQMEYGLTEEYGSLTDMDTNLVNSHSMGLTGLKAGKTYHYRVVSRDASNNQAASGDNTFTTTARSGGMPVWAWVIIVLALVAVLGAAACFVWRRLAEGQQP